MKPSLRIFQDGRQEWRLPNGKLHRLDGPAVTWPDGTQKWYRYGKRHRLDGPSSIMADGREFWFVDGLHFPNIKKILSSTAELLAYWNEIHYCRDERQALLKLASHHGLLTRNQLKVITLSDTI